MDGLLIAAGVIGGLYSLFGIICAVTAGIDGDSRTMFGTILSMLVAFFLWPLFCIATSELPGAATVDTILDRIFSWCEAR